MKMVPIGAECVESAIKSRNNNNNNPITSWLGGLGLVSNGNSAANSPRRCSLPSSPSHNHNRASIVDDIRNDQELFFADDEMPPSLTLPPSIHNTVMLSGYESHGSIQTMIQSRRPSSSGGGTTSVGLGPRRSSQKKMDDLQREVDLALEYFGMETENELDEFDGDDYLENRKYQRVDDHKVGGRLRRLSSGDECESFPGTATTAAMSMGTSTVVSDDGDQEFTDCHTKLLSFSDQPGSPSSSSSEGPETSKISNGLSLKHKTKSIITLPLSLLPSQTAMNCCSTEEEDMPVKFENAMAEELYKLRISKERYEDQIFSADFISSSVLRNAMEPFLCVARLQREAARQAFFDTLDKIIMPEEPQAVASRRTSPSGEGSFHIGSTYGVPYPALRNESSFLYDVESFPLGEVLCKSLGVNDLSKLHIDYPLIKDKRRLLASLHNRGTRRKFHQCFDSFVTSQVIPLLHSQALSTGTFYTNREQLQKGKPQRIVYRYQAFPTINIVRPGECSTDPHCDMAQGHSIGNISYHIPLTATFGTNAVYTESRPGREDWHPLATKSPGLGFQYDGARCLHFNLKNETDITRVSLNFRIAITRAPDFDDIAYDPNDQLCCPELLNDKFSLDNPGFYDEVVVNVGDVPGPLATKRRSMISVIG